ncbi:methylated-DNA--[protein]-cysteine S-methyltransferase [Phascolarctobacterium sp.]
MYYSTVYLSPLGKITLACDADGKNLVGLWLEGQKHYGASLDEPLTENDSVPLFDAAKNWLDRYFAGAEPELAELPLAPRGSEFRQGVWEILCAIPYGEVITYGAIAKKMASRLRKKSMSGQAVGGAVGHNPISIIIPCHRVVGADGSLTGYAGGLEKKIRLLELEGVDTARFSLPKKGTAL